MENLRINCQVSEGDILEVSPSENFAIGNITIKDCLVIGLEHSEDGMYSYYNVILDKEKAELIRDKINEYLKS